jgi:hypothetical protein
MSAGRPFPWPMTGKYTMSGLKAVPLWRVFGLGFVDNALSGKLREGEESEPK